MLLKSADREGRIERQSSRNRGPRLVQPTELREGGSEMEMRDRNISVGLDRTTQPPTASSSLPRRSLAKAGDHHPGIGKVIARTEAQRFKDMAFGFLGATG